MQRAIRKAIADTSANTGMVMTVAFDYGSRAEITRSAKNLIRDNQLVTTENLSLNLYDSSLPPVDVLVRTSGESRISNFCFGRYLAQKFTLPTVLGKILMLLS